MNYGRPLRFLAILLLSWVCARLYFISPFAGEDGGDAPALIAERMPDPIRVERPAEPSTGDTEYGVPRTEPSTGDTLVGVARTPARSSPGAAKPARRAIALARRPATPRFATRSAPPPFVTPPAPPLLRPIDPAPRQPAEFAAAAGSAAPPLLALQPDATAPAPVRARRLSGYAFAFVREGGGASGLAGSFSQLGGSQAGLRLDYALGRDPAKGLALTARAYAPLAVRPGREAAVGLKYKPLRNSSLAFVAERRIGLNRGGRDAFAAYAYGGVGPFALPAGFRLEAYGQAGVVGLKSTDLFADGQVTALKTVTSTDRVNVSVGAGAWGGTQPGASRLDIGPRVRAGLNLPGGRGVGLSVDYRVRIAGDARPGSGVAVTLDTSF